MRKSSQKGKAAQPFKAKLRHYHRSASPELYTKKQKRWEEVSPVDLSDTAMPKVSKMPNVSAPVSSKPKE